jgi:AbrB family looped-hinge helix DNA binding protein
MFYRRYAMADVATTKMSSKGQVVIPETIRKRLNLRAGSQFVVVGENDVVILKTISPPAMNDFDRLIADTRKKVKLAGIKPSDITAAIAKVRGRK